MEKAPGSEIPFDIFLAYINQEILGERKKHPTDKYWKHKSRTKNKTNYLFHIKTAVFLHRCVRFNSLDKIGSF